VQSQNVRTKKSGGTAAVSKKSLALEGARATIKYDFERDVLFIYSDPVLGLR
jgi:hypothetical protein